jgi:hypothetical protein
MQESTYGAAPPVATAGEGLDATHDATLKAALAKEELKDAKDAVKRSKKHKKTAVAKTAAAAAADDDGEQDSEDEDDDNTNAENGAGGVGVASSLSFDQAPKVPGSQHLLSAIAQQLGPDFELLAHVMRGQMRIRAYVRKSLRKECTAIETGAENTGLGGVVANKGGQALKFELRGTSLVFVNAHLAAHESAKKCDARNANVAEVLHGLRFGADKRHDLTQFDHVFWFGDLNYRLEPPHEVHDIKAEPPSLFKNWPTILWL